MRRELDELLATVAVNSARISDLESRVDTRIDTAVLRELRDEGLVRAEQVDQLQEALASSRTIGTAVGMVMQKLDVDAETAFAVLSRVSQTSNRKVRDLAAQVVEARSVEAVLREQRRR